LPVFGVFDLHANISGRMAGLADGLVRTQMREPQPRAQ
jgi:hypothetical protein